MSAYWSTACCSSALLLDGRIHADAVVDAEVFTRFVKHGYGVARIGAEVNPHVGELRSQGLHHTRHIEVRAECCMGGAVQQHGQHHVIVFSAGDCSHQVLILLVEAMIERELLLAVRGVVEHVNVERDLGRRLVEGLHEAVDEPFFQPQQRAWCDSILEPRERRLAGQVIVVGQPVGEQLEDGILSECIVIVLIFVAGDDAKDATAGHLQKGMIGILSRIVQLRRELASEVQLLIEFSKQQHARIGCEMLRDGFNDNRFVSRKSQLRFPNIL